MEVFGQYAATRLLNTHPMAVRERVPVRAGADDTERAVIYTWAGVDLVTGMPVLVYSLPGQPPAIKAVYSEFLPAVLETGERDEMAYVIAAFAPGYVPVKPGLPESRLHWLARSSARALFDAHVGGLVHGDLRPEHFFAQGDHLIVAGFGLPWADEHSPFRAPEGSGEFPADVYAWARCVQHFASGSVETGIGGDLGSLVGHCLNADPRERPTAGELVLALDQVLGEHGTGREQGAREAGDGGPPAAPIEAKAAASPAPTSPTQTSPAPTNPTPITPTLTNPTLEPPPAAPNDATPAPKPAPPEPTKPPTVTPEVTARAVETPDVVVLPSAPALPEPARPTLRAPTASEAVPDTHPLREPEGMEADEPDVPIIVRSSSPYGSGDFSGNDRPGWNEYNPVERQPSGRRWPISRLLVGAGLLAVFALMAYTLISRNPATGNPEPNAPVRPAPTAVTPPAPAEPSSNFVVNFEIEGDGQQKGRLIVVGAPPESGLRVGDMLATVPGPVLFTAAGQYTLQIALEGFEPKETVINVPSPDNRVILKLQ